MSCSISIFSSENCCGGLTILQYNNRYPILRDVVLVSCVRWEMSTCVQHLVRRIVSGLDNEMTMIAIHYYVQFLIFQIRYEFHRIFLVPMIRSIIIQPYRPRIGQHNLAWYTLERMALPPRERRGNLLDWQQRVSHRFRRHLQLLQLL